MPRRIAFVLAALIQSLSSAPGWAVEPPATPAGGSVAPLSRDDFLKLETYRLWPGRAPQASSDGDDETPTLTLFRPPMGAGNGTAVIVAPGGGYIGLAVDLEGRQVADWFTSRGVTAFLLKYRIGPKARLPIPLLDGARAVRFVRANAKSFRIDPARVGMIGFSAGGHLSAMTATEAATGQADAADPVERVSSRPDFLILGYPWLEATDIRPDGKSWYCIFAKTNCRPADYVQFSPFRTLRADMPPTFIYHTTNDSLVPVGGSVRFYTALQERKVPVEFHAFQSGPHGTGLGGVDPALGRWPDLLEQWLRALKLLEKSRPPG